MTFDVLPLLSVHMLPRARVLLRIQLCREAAAYVDLRAYTAGVAVELDLTGVLMVTVMLNLTQQIIQLNRCPIGSQKNPGGF